MTQPCLLAPLSAKFRCTHGDLARSWIADRRSFVVLLDLGCRHATSLGEVNLELAVREYVDKMHKLIVCESYDASLPAVCDVSGPEVF